MHPLFELLTDLESARIPFTLARYRPDTVLVAITIPGERIEIDVFEDGHVEVARFAGSEAIVGGRETVEAIIRAASREA